MNRPDLKFDVLYAASVLNRSGYGVASDLIFHSLNKYPRFNLKTIQLPNGGCAFRQIAMPGDELIKASILKQPPQKAPHIFISHCLPSCLNPCASLYNINISAGIESTIAPKFLIDALDKYELGITCSNHSKLSYVNGGSKAPIEVLPWSINTNIFKPDAVSQPNVNEVMNQIKEQEVWLFTGQSPQRKDMDGLIACFSETFKGKENKPALLLKTSDCSYSSKDRNMMIERITNVRNSVKDNNCQIYLLHGEMREPEIAALNAHPKVIAHISLTRGEGFGLCTLEGICSGKPFFISNWSAQTEFIPSNFPTLLPGQVLDVDPQYYNQFFGPGAKWFQADYLKVGEIMLKYQYGDRTELKNQSMELAKVTRQNYSFDKFNQRLHSILDQHLGTL